ncbi:hypothetical protein T484DRAFT_1786411 [Baffinella frigidus]|nr:hypothetical protein T484DRAFT_1786411 [Cryptophyta sp. CCMP2293]
MLSSITHVCPDDAPAKNSREGAAKNAGSKHPASPEPRPSGAGFPPQKKLKQGTQAAPGGRVIFPKAIKVLIVHKTLWCTCAECTEARLLVCAHSHSGGLLQHKEVDAVIQRARGDLESMRQLLTSSRVIVAVHPDARAGDVPAFFGLPALPISARQCVALSWVRAVVDNGSVIAVTSHPWIPAPEPAPASAEPTPSKQDRSIPQPPAHDKKLFVGGIPWTFDSEDLREAFSSFESLKNASVVYDRETKKSRGFGFVTFEETGAAEKACKHMDQAEVGGRTINVNFAQGRAPRA